MSPTGDGAAADLQQTIADLRRQLDEALARETALAEVLGVINSSPGDLAPVFDTMLEKAMRLCEAAFGTLWTYDGDRFRSVAQRGVPRPYADYLAQNAPLASAGTGRARILRGEAFVHVADLKDEEPYRSGDPHRRAMVDLGRARTGLIVPLRKDDAVIGFVMIYRQQVRPFSARQIALLQNFAAQAVIAMENARLLTETREALEQQTATAEVLQVINSSPGDLAPVFDAMLDKAMALCDIAHGGLQIYDGQQFRAVSVRGLPEPLAALLRQGGRPAPGHPILRLLESDRFVQVPDLTQVAPELGNVMRIAVEAGVRTLLFIPLRKDDALLGVIVAVRRQVRPFSEKEIALLENFAAQAVIAIENARLLTETREALEQQTATAEVLRVINSSPGDLAPVFDAILEKAHSLCGVDIGSLELYDSGKFRSVAMRGLSGPVVELLREPFEPSPGSPGARLLDGEPIVQVSDLAELATRRGDDLRVQAAADHGLRSVLFVPLRLGGSLCGLISAGRKQVRPFTEKQIALLQNFAAQAVIAIENARLLGELRQRTEEVAELNRGLEARVAEQVEELGRVGRLRRFLAPQLAELIVSRGDEKILESHRREIVVVFCDLRGYTAFTETAEPEEVLDFLREYHGALGPLVAAYEGTLDQFSGDGIMVFFNDPVPCPDPAERAVKMAMAMREEAGKLIATWRRDGCELGFGAGIAQGYATLGQIGFSERSGYTAIGTVCNLAARLCAEAKDGQILISGRVARAVEAVARLEDLGNLELRGLRRPVTAFNVVQSRSAAAARPNLTVVAREPGA